MTVALWTHLTHFLCYVDSDLENQLAAINIRILHLTGEKHAGAKRLESFVEIEGGLPTQLSRMDGSAKQTNKKL